MTTIPDIARPLAAFVLVFASTASFAAPRLEPTEPNLDIVPRTEAEAARVARVTAAPVGFDAAEPFEARPAGAATVRARSDSNAFSQPSANISFERELEFKVGNGLFRKLWVSSPSSTQGSDGLGPLYNARSCQRCHLKDGRGHPPNGPDDEAVSMFLRISVPAAPNDAMSQIETYLTDIGDDAPRTRPDPVYGGQMQDFGVAGHPAEYRLDITYDEIKVPLSDGEVASLRAPTYGAANLGYGPLGDGAMLSPRVAPQMLGLGLLEAIPAADILTAADPDDADGDGISGKAQIVWSDEFDQPMLGRFGWKAGAPTVKHQSAAAFAGDIGISSPLFAAPAGDCTEAQSDCLVAPHGDGDERITEIDTEGLDLVTFYSRNLAVPARRDEGDPQVLRGKEQFFAAGCAACHTPKFVTHRLIDQPEQSFQLIWPHTDLLLHDMGDGLADNRPEGRANGREWRTAPLWGIGMTETVSGHTYFLHDGRARSLLEAILWHGGEAQAARDTVINMPKPDRDALIRYLESL
ncbi:di-heme oxidoreductase family protein [Sedimentitalea todarodis]|uniref:Di-heme oxidoredictase family protein n=1 Tax=Sedimentitalea todarodis TaxID=1631240 RepID=A0ABU3V9S5_9RHOB|nr:di-heme oxidoredictase family protein [Sedimentitalea todarodis]MDU9002915.1 di-heme oxidoredictase family protein [Sedimentitalea todarodis]